MKTPVFFFLLFLITGCFAFATDSKYPYGLLTSGYDIVTEDDLAFDHLKLPSTQYNSSSPFNSLHWQCFPTNQVSAKIRSWSADDERGKPAIRCSPEVYIRHNGELQLYVDRRGHPLEHCKEFIWAWNKLTAHQTNVCINGDGGAFHQDEIDGKYKLWTWEKFKTKSGCYSYFFRQCKTRGCATGKCPRS